MKLTILLLFLFLAGTLVANSALQEQIVTGTVTDADTGEPLPDVNVLVEGTRTGVSTDLNGKFSLPQPANGAIIAFSFVGYTTERITYTGQPVVDMKLSQAVKELDQVVVIGYGTIKKSDLTGSVASVSSKDIEKSSPVNIQSALQGRVAGLMITSNSGDPGSEPTIRLRGIGTVNNNNPIYVVDGMLIDNSEGLNSANNISFLNPWDIASLEVLKDASAQAIYGSRGANGVILITTRKGTEGAPKVTFSSSVGFEGLARWAKVLNADEYKDYILTANYNGYMRSMPGADPNVLPDNLNPTTKAVVEQYKKGFDTDWMKEVLRKDRFSQNYNLLLSGGTKDIHYSASAGYTDKKGLLLYSDYKRYSYRLNTDFKVGNYVTLGENLGISTSIQTGDWYWTDIIRGAMWDDPLTPVLKPEGSVDVNDPDYKYNKYAPLTVGWNPGGVNPVMQAALLDMKTSHLTLVGNMFAEASIFKDLKLRSSWGFNMATKDFTSFSPKYYLSTVSNKLINQLTEEDYRSNGWVWENTLTWNKKLNDHSITALLGYTSEYTKSNYQKASKQGSPSNDPEMQTFDAATIQPTVVGGYNIFTMISYLGRINYSFRDKYLLTASVRRDGSSKFGPGHRWGIFPSFSLGWKISDEKFFRNLGAEFISNLKIRAGWGQIGNSSLPVYNAYVSQIESTPSSGEDYRYIFDEKIYQGYWLRTIGTPNITWETTEQTNIGLEIAILKNTLSVTADYFIKNTRNMLLQVPVVEYAGYPPSAAPYTNAGSVQNKGFEILVNYQGKTGNFTYGVAVNGATFKNKVTSLGPGNRPIVQPWVLHLGSICRTEVGSSIGRFYGYVTDGIFQTDKEVQDYKGPSGKLLQPMANAGDFRFKNLNNDEKIDASDQTWIGDPWPRLIYGFNINFGYKAFDMVAFFQGSYGNDLYDAGRKYGNSQFTNCLKYVNKNAWRGEGTSDSHPIITTVDENENYSRNSDYYVEKGSYLRLKNIQFGYNLPKAICDKVKITNSRIWIGSTNLLTFTKYHGNDPEVGATSTPTSNAGLDQAGFYPKSREISLGITVSF
jgi:TonB-linked SusC/RagA family outer membrane protein